MKNIILLIIFAILAVGCTRSGKVADQPTSEMAAGNEKNTTRLSEKDYYNKVLGLLVGSAIGDAMGAPTEMWSRKDIQLEYGFVRNPLPKVPGSTTCRLEEQRMIPDGKNFL
jgi:ADP-ribosylglycohydrolase